MTTDEQIAAARLAEDRHREVTGLLKELIGMMMLATSQVVRGAEYDPVAVSHQIERVIDEVK